MEASQSVLSKTEDLGDVRADLPAHPRAPAWSPPGTCRALRGRARSRPCHLNSTRKATRLRTARAGSYLRRSGPRSCLYVTRVRSEPRSCAASNATPTRKSCGSAVKGGNMSYIRAILVDKRAPANLSLGEIEKPSPAPSEALVRVSSISLNRGEVRRTQAT